MLIPSEVIDRCNESDTLEVVSDFVSLKKKGNTYWALSPFKDEKTPSFTVNPQKNLFKCFSTGIGGNAVTFVMEYEKCSFVDAIKIVANKLNIEIPEPKLNEHQQKEYNYKESIYIALEQAKKHYYTNLQKNEKALNYTLYGRNISKEMIDLFGIGFVPNEWNNLKNHLIEKGFDEKVLLDSSLLKESNNRTYDFLRCRLMFPLKNEVGRIVGFSGRNLSKEQKGKTGKYINSANTIVFDKSKFLYGYFEAKKTIRIKDECFLTEGQTDVIKSHQYNFDNTICSLGTGFTEYQAQMIKKLTNNLTLVLDGDSAGETAILRYIKTGLKNGLNINIVRLPNGYDPDNYLDFVGESNYKKYIKKHKVDFCKYLYLSFNPDSPMKKDNAIKETLQYINLIQDKISKKVWIDYLMSFSGIEAKAEKPKPTKKIAFKNNNSSGWEIKFIKLLLLHGTKLEQGENLGMWMLDEVSEISFKDSLCKKVLNIYKERLDRNLCVDLDCFLALPDLEIVDFLTSIGLGSQVNKSWNNLINYEKSSIFNTIFNHIIDGKLLILQSLQKQNLFSSFDLEKKNQINEAIEISIRELKQRKIA